MAGRLRERLRAARPMPAGRPHRGCRQRQSQMDDRRPASGGAQNPAYRPTHPLHTRVTCERARLSGWRGTSGAHAHRGECPVEGIPGAAARLRDEVPVQVYGGRDRLVPKPVGDLRDRHSFGQGRAGESVPADGVIMVSRQRIRVGRAHAGKLVTVILEDTHLRVVHDGEELTLHPRTTTPGRQSLPRIRPTQAI